MLALLDRGATGWPPLPEAPGVRAALLRGQNLFDAAARGSECPGGECRGGWVRLKLWMDQVDQVFQRCLNEARGGMVWGLALERALRGFQMACGA